MTDLAATATAPTPPPDPLELLTKHGWARKLGVDPGLIDELAAAGDLPYLLLPGRSRRLFQRRDLEAALDQRKNRCHALAPESSSRSRIARPGTTTGRSRVIGFEEALAKLRKRRPKK